MKRAAIYARYSTDLQADRSIEDQVAQCREYATRNGLDIVAVYSDRARSGASLHNRTGMIELLGAARARAFDVLIVESTSRIGRNVRDRADIRDRLAFADIKMMTPTGGVVTRLLDGVTAVIDAQRLEDDKVAIRRGLAGRVREGKYAGGRPYGYRPVRRIDDKGELVRGELAIVEAEADVVRRIFARYAAGDSPRKIAAALNADGVPAPRGRAWRDTTMVGAAHAMLTNEIYAGVIVWNRVHMVKDPDTGKRHDRPNPPSEWQRHPAEHLRIVPQPVWEAVQARRKARVGLPQAQRATPRRVLSGLLRCGACGGGMSISGAYRRSGRIRIACGTAKNAGPAACGNRRYYDLALIEERVIGAMRKELGSPERLALYVRTYNEERARLAGRAGAERARLERRVAETKRALDRAIEQLVYGRLTDAEADAVLPGLRQAHEAAAAALAAAGEPAKVISLHPGAVDRYLADLHLLADAITRDQAEGHREAAEAMRRVVERVTVMPAPAGTAPEIAVDGHLASLIDAPAFPRQIIQPDQLPNLHGTGKRRAQLRHLQFRLAA